METHILMDAKLVVVRGKASKGHIALHLPTIIGRSREADLTIAHPTISRKHCELFEEEGLLKIRDLGSLNGTFVGRKQIKQSELRPDQEFSIGPLTFRVLYKYDGTAAKGPTAPDSDSNEIEDLPDFSLLGDMPDDGPSLDSPPEPKTVGKKSPAQPAARGQANGSSANADSDVLDFLLDDSPKGKKAGKGADDDELDQFFKDLG